MIAWTLARHLAPGFVRGAAAGSWAPPAAALRRACERLGPAFVKLGQFLSVRPDLVPPEALAELEALQDAASALPPDAILSVVERDLGAPMGRLFREFDPRPLASASVSQVHRATLPGGEAVAVKVRRPGAAAAIRRDMRLCVGLACAVVRRTPLAGRVDVRALGEEVEASLHEELDFRREAEVAEAFARAFRAWPDIRVPRVYWGWTSRRVLTAEFVGGVKISDPSVRWHPDYARLADLGARAFLKQVLEDGLFHADLHPANLLITPSGEIAYLDFGIVGRLTVDERAAVLGALAGLLTRDSALALRHLTELGVRVPPEELEPFVHEVGRALDAALAPRLADVSLARVGRGILSAVHRHRVSFPRKCALLLKALLTVEGTARGLHPEFSFEEVARGHLLDWGRRTLTAGRLAEAAWRGAALLGLGALGAGRGP